MHLKSEEFNVTQLQMVMIKKNFLSKEKHKNSCRSPDKAQGQKKMGCPSGEYTWSTKSLNDLIF